MEKVTEIPSPKNKQLGKLKKFSHKLGEVKRKSDVEDDVFQTLAVENTRNDIQPRETYDTLLKKTLSNMQKRKSTF